MERIPDKDRQRTNVSIAKLLIESGTLPKRFIWTEQLEALKQSGGMSTPQDNQNRQEVEWLFGKKTGVIFDLWQHMKS